jgi:hypothetical protein
MEPLKWEEMQRIAVFHKMKNTDVFDFTLLSVIDMLLQELLVRCGTGYRESRVESMQSLLSKVEESYKGYIPENYKNKAEQFLKVLHLDLDSTLKAIKTIKE